MSGFDARKPARSLAESSTGSTAARRGHEDISLFHDLDAGRRLFACEGRKAEVVAAFADDLEDHSGCAENIGALCIDLSTSYRAGVATHLPWAEVTFDEVHRQELKANPGRKEAVPRFFRDPFLPPFLHDDPFSFPGTDNQSNPPPSPAE